MVQRGALTLVLALASAAPAHAESAPVWVWYRSTAGCPDGEAFVSRLSELGKTARLARVGDRVDFVVTLGAGAGSEKSSGRLERQTRGGTVAIREYRDDHCDRVAEALALTLDLAIEPDGPPAPPSAEPPAPPAPMAPDAAPPVGAEAAALPAPRSPLALGVQATLATGVAPAALPGAGVFVELTPVGGLPAALRGTLLGSYGSSQVEQREIQVSLWAARLDVCPIAWGTQRLSVAPCAGLDAGLLRAAGSEPLGAADSGFWSAALALGRVAAQVGGGVSIELSVGARVPLLRYEMGTRDGSAAWFRTDAVGLDAGLGAAWQIP